MWLREPTLHRHKAVGAISDQIRNTMRSVLRNPLLVPIMTVLVMGTVLQYMMFEFAQLWLLALHTPTAWFGPANAVILGTLAVGGWLAQYARRWRLLLWGVLAAMIAGSLGIVTLHNVPGVVLAQFLVLAGAITLDVIFLRNLHDGLTSQVRAGASSAVGSMGRAAIIPFALIFGTVSSEYGIYTAGWLLTALAVAIAGFVTVLEARRRTGATSYSK
jgi:predicted MFS family arabinose efflux permease